MAFDPPQIDTDEDAVTERILTGLATRLEGWEPYEGAPEVALAEELGREIAVLNQAAIDSLDLAVAGLGQTAFGFPAFDGAPAEIPVAIALTTAGTVVPAGLTVVGLNDNGEEVAFELLTDIGAETTPVLATLVATEAGDFGNGVPIGHLTVVTATTNVTTVTATATSTNGADAELIEDYLDRLADFLGTLRPGGVTAADLAALARSVPSVHRAIAADLYDPANPVTPAERTVTVFPVDETSHPVTAAVKMQLEAVLAETREVNFIIHIEDPTYTAVAIDYDVIAEDGADPLIVKAEVDTALAGMLTSWGTSTSDDQAWNETTAVRILDVVRVIGTAPGVGAVSSLTINGNPTDLVIPGPAALPAPLDDPLTPSTITGTVS